MFTQHSKESDAKRFHLEKVESIQGTSWMAVVWYVKDGRLVLADRTTWNFPLEDLEEAIRQLREMCEKELKGLGEGSPPVPMPLKVAAFAEGDVEVEGDCVDEVTEATAEAVIGLHKELEELDESV